MSYFIKRHDLYPELIIIRNFSGSVNSKEIIDSWKSIIENNVNNKNLIGIINDLTNCELQINLDSFKNILDFMNKQDFLKKLKIAVISESPNQIIFPFIAQKNEKDLNIKPFSTMDAATNWIIINL